MSSDMTNPTNKVKNFQKFINESNETTNDGMKELLIQALDEAFVKLEKQVPQTKKQTKSISILDVKPLNLLEFMKANNVPDDADFDGKDNGYDGWNDILLSWSIDVPTTDKDKLDFKRRRFSDVAFKCVYDLLTKNGYKRNGYNTGLLKQFDDTTVYDMYMSKDFDRLVKYYSLPFKHE